MRSSTYRPKGSYGPPWFQQVSKVGAYQYQGGPWLALWQLDGERYPDNWLGAFDTKAKAETYALGRVGHNYATQYGDADHDLRVVRFTADELAKIGPAPKPYGW